MTTEDVMLALEIFDRIRNAVPEDRDRLLETDADLNVELREYVRTLLAHDSPTGQFLGRSVRATTLALASSTDLAPLPDWIGPYKVKRLIGRGGFGAVFLAEEPQTRRLVAVKLLRPVFTSADRRRLEFEAEALGRLNHEGIARVYASGLAVDLGNCPYIAMEYVDGLPIDEHVRELRPSVNERVKLMILLARAVEHAHQQGVLHRDLSPRNVLIDSSGRPKVLDFGLAASADRENQTMTMLTASGDVMGTLRYMSPEHLSGDSRAIDTRSDTFALGLIAYELVCDRHPFVTHATSTGAVMRQMLHSAAPRAGSLNRTCRGDLEIVLGKAIDRDPRRRYQSAGAFGDDLERWLARRPVTARPASPFYLACRYADRHRAAAAAGTTVLAVVLAAATHAALSVRRELEAHGSAITALDVVVSRVLAPLAPKIGTLDDREALLTAIEPDLERMARQQPNDKRVLRILARYLVAKSDVHRQRGSIVPAYHVQSRAVGSYTRLWARAEHTVELGHEFSIALVKLGDLEKAQGREDAAFAEYHRALALDEHMADRFPTSIPVLSNLFWSITRFEEQAVLADDPSAREWLVRAATVAQRMSELDPDAWRSLEARAFTSSRRFKREPDLMKAFPHILEAIDAAERLVQREPGVMRHHGMLILHYLDAVDAAMRLDRLEVAASMLPKAEQAMSRISTDAEDPYVQSTFIDPVQDRLVWFAARMGDVQPVVAVAEKRLHSLQREIDRGINLPRAIITKGEWHLILCTVYKDAEHDERLAQNKAALIACLEELEHDYAGHELAAEPSRRWRRVLAELGRQADTGQ